MFVYRLEIQLGSKSIPEQVIDITLRSLYITTFFILSRNIVHKNNHYMVYPILQQLCPDSILALNHEISRKYYLESHLLRIHQ